MRKFVGILGFALDCGIPICYNVLEVIMNKKALAVLAAINNTSKDGEAVIIEKDELICAIPHNLRSEEGEINDILKDLTLTGLIKLKYQDGDTYCVTPLPKGKLIVESEKDEDLDTSITVKIDYKRIAKIAFLFSFLGSLLAGLIIFIFDLIFD